MSTGAPTLERDPSTMFHGPTREQVAETIRRMENFAEGAARHASGAEWYGLLSEFLFQSATRMDRLFFRVEQLTAEVAAARQLAWNVEAKAEGYHSELTESRSRIEQLASRLSRAENYQCTKCGSWNECD